MPIDTPTLPAKKIEELVINYRIPQEERKEFLQFCLYLQTLSLQQNDIFKDKVRYIFRRREIENYSQSESVKIMFSLYKEGYRV